VSWPSGVYDPMIRIPGATGTKTGDWRQWQGKLSRATVFGGNNHKSTSRTPSNYRCVLMTLTLRSSSHICTRHVSVTAVLANRKPLNPRCVTARFPFPPCQLLLHFLGRTRSMVSSSLYLLLITRSRSYVSCLLCISHALSRQTIPFAQHPY
jgi:hypothetical protein